MATSLQRSRRVPSVEKAAYQQFDGKVLRKFFGLSPADEDAIEREIGVSIETHLSQSAEGRST